MEIKKLSKYSKDNKFYVQNSDFCGCYHCVSIFAADEVKDWIDKGETALCPKCHIDSVLADSVVDITDKLLEEASKYWF